MSSIRKIMHTVALAGSFALMAAATANSGSHSAGASHSGVSVKTNAVPFQATRPAASSKTKDASKKKEQLEQELRQKSKDVERLQKKLKQVSSSDSQKFGNWITGSDGGVSKKSQTSPSHIRARQRCRYC